MSGNTSNSGNTGGDKKGDDDFIKKTYTSFLVQEAEKSATRGDKKNDSFIAGHYLGYLEEEAEKSSAKVKKEKREEGK
jgi:hypothetical protein